MSSEPSPSIESEYVQATRQQVRNMIAELAQLAKSDLAPAEFYEALLSRAVSALVAIGGVVWTVDDEGGWDVGYQINLQSSGLAGDAEAQARHSRLLRRAIHEPDGMLVAPHAGPEDDQEAGNPTEYLLILAPLTTNQQRHGLVEIFQRPGAGPVTQRGYLRFVLQLCELAGGYLASRQLRHFADRETLWGQLERFTKSVHESLDPRQTAYRIVNEGRRLIECDRVSVAIQRGRKCRIEAISHQDQIDKRSNVASLLSRLATRVAATGDVVWYTGSTEDMPPQVEDALQEYVDESHAKVVGVLPLFEPDQPDTGEEELQPHRSRGVIGTLIVEQFDNAALENRTLQRVEVVQDHAASALSNALEHNRVFLM
ncbi:MAG: hemolysin D, partial [Planctomycetales bacterium]|nr:hemolysin D [Planctomycetales bacterium]